MHLFKKWSKYAFAYASMQMHNYPKPIHYSLEQCFSTWVPRNPEVPPIRCWVP